MVVNRGNRSNRLCQLLARSSCIKVFLPKREMITFEREECWIWLRRTLLMRKYKLRVVKVLSKAWLFSGCL